MINLFLGLFFTLKDALKDIIFLAHRPSHFRSDATIVPRNRQSAVGVYSKRKNPFEDSDAWAITE